MKRFFSFIISLTFIINLQMQAVQILPAIAATVTWSVVSTGTALLINQACDLKLEHSSSYSIPSLLTQGIGGGTIGTLTAIGVYKILEKKSSQTQVMKVNGHTILMQTSIQ